MGSGHPPRPQTLRPTSFYFNVLSRRVKVAEIEFEVRATCPSPALARAMWPHILAGSIRRARAALHPPLTLALPSIRGGPSLCAGIDALTGARLTPLPDALSSALLAPPPCTVAAELSLPCPSPPPSPPPIAYRCPRRRLAACFALCAPLRCRCRQEAPPPAETPLLAAPAAAIVATAAVAAFSAAAVAVAAASDRLSPPSSPPRRHIAPLALPRLLPPYRCRGDRLRRHFRRQAAARCRRRRWFRRPRRHRRRSRLRRRRVRGWRVGGRDCSGYTRGACVRGARSRAPFWSL